MTRPTSQEIATLLRATAEVVDRLATGKEVSGRHEIAPSLRATADALSQPAPTIDMNTVGLRLMPNAWPHMTEKERAVYVERWLPIVRAAGVEG